MDELFNSISLTGVAASLAKAMDIPAPAQAHPSIAAIDRLVQRSTESGCVDRIFMYNPDAIAMWLYQKYTDYYLPLLDHAKLTLPLRTVMPSVTPVCFGTMYTGAEPEVHGIRTYVKPVIKIDTLFDALLRAGKKCAIVSTEGDSLSHIFLEREMDYFIYPTVDECTTKALELIREDRHDFILLYNADYDSTMHRFAPEAAESLEILKKNIHVFDTIARTIKTHWNAHETLLGFAPDHGCHEIDGGLGSHGLEMPEDLNILHFYTVI